VNIALAGLPLAGKTCLFDALSEGAVDASVNPARADHPNTALVAVPDERLDWLNDHYRAKKRVPISLEWVDLPGLASGRSDLASQNTAITEHLRRAEAIVYVLRAFASGSVPGRVDPIADRAALAGEFLLADLAVIERRVEKVEAQMAKPIPNRDALKQERAFLDRCLEALEAEQPLQGVPQTVAERDLLRSFAALTLKPTITVLNVDENDAGDPAAVAAAHPDVPAPVFALCASLEAEIRSLPPDERESFLSEMGLDRLHTPDFLRVVHDALDRLTFYTAGEKEVTARSLPRGSSAVDAAGAVHTDMAKGFVRAEVVTFDDFKAAGGLKQAKADGHARLEGRDYVVRDGDVILFHFTR